MTEVEWLACDSPRMLLEALSEHPDRDLLRLLACRLCLLPEVRRLLEVKAATAFLAAAEGFIAGRATWNDVSDAARQSPRGRVSGGSWRSHNPVRLAPTAQALRMIAVLETEDGWDAAWGVTREGVNLLGSEACTLIRELFPPPNE